MYTTLFLFFICTDISDAKICMHMEFQPYTGCQGTGKTVYLDVHFPDGESTGNLPKVIIICFYTGKK